MIRGRPISGTGNRGYVLGQWGGGPLFVTVAMIALTGIIFFTGKGTGYSKSYKIPNFFYENGMKELCIRDLLSYILNKEHLHEQTQFERTR